MPGEAELIVGLIDHFQQAQGSYYVRFLALREAPRSYVVVTLSKEMGDYPLGGAQVSERYPPLSERLPSMNRQALWLELGKRAPDSKGWIPFERDILVLRELLTRGPMSTVEIEDYVFAHRGESAYMAMRAMLAAMTHHHVLMNYSGAIRDVIVRREVFNGYEQSIAGLIFGAAERSGADYTDVALEFVRHGRFVEASMRYFGGNVSDPEKMQALAAIDIDPKYEAKRKTAIEIAKKRLSGEQAK